MLGGWKMKAVARSRNAWDGISNENIGNDHLYNIIISKIRIFAPNKYTSEFLKNDFVGGNKI